MIKKEEIKLIATDLDGTLLSRNGEASPFTCSIINQLTKLGITFVPSTSRSYNELPLSLATNDIRYYVCINGAALYDKEHDTLINSHFLDVDYVYKLLEACSSVKKVINVVTSGIIHSEKPIVDYYLSYGFSEKDTNRILKKRVMVDDAYTILKDLKYIDKLHLNFHTNELAEKCRKLIPESDKYSITSSTSTNIEITNLLAKKGLAIYELCDLLAIDKNKIMACGDNKNDLSLFEVAKIKVAMSNGAQVLKTEADYITDYSCDQDGLALFFKDYFDLE